MTDFRGRLIQETDEVLIFHRGSMKEGIIDKVTGKGAQVKFINLRNNQVITFIKSQYIYKKE